MLYDAEVLLSAWSSIWIARPGYNVATALSAKDGHSRGSWSTGQFPVYMVYDGKLIWTTCLQSNRIDGLRPRDGYAQKITVDTRIGIAFDGANLWVTNYGSDTVSKIPRER